MKSEFKQNEEKYKKKQQNQADIINPLILISCVFFFIIVLWIYRIIIKISEKLKQAKVKTITEHALVIKQLLEENELNNKVQMVTTCIGPITEFNLPVFLFINKKKRMQRRRENSRNF
jgi:flagellar biosynthesis/type III secretory pathway M-ring protein FliF/YscJ